MRVFHERLSVCASFPFDFEGGMRDLIVLIPDHCLSTYFSIGTYLDCGIIVSSNLTKISSREGSKILRN